MAEGKAGFHYHLIHSNSLPDPYEMEQTIPEAQMKNLSFTFNAREALTAAQEKAMESGNNTLSDIHLFWGLLVDLQDRPTQILKQLKADIDQIKARLLASLPPREQIKLGEVPTTPEWQTALLQASEEADHIQQAKVSSEQLLLGLARNQSGTTNSIFQQLNISAEQIRQLI